MTISHYGVWACTPTRYTSQTEKQDPRSPHIYLYFTDDSSSSKRLEAAVNVKSTDKDTRLVFWLNRNFSHPITETLSNLDQGFHLARSSSSSNENKSTHHSRHRHYRRQTSTVQGLDFFRTKDLVDIKAGRGFSRTISQVPTMTFWMSWIPFSPMRSTRRLPLISLGRLMDRESMISI